MASVIAEGCTKDGLCVDVCEVDAIATSDAHDQYFIDPDQCIDCGACESECPTGSIYPIDDVPADQKKYIELNATFFK